MCHVVLVSNEAYCFGILIIRRGAVNGIICLFNMLLF